MDGWMDETPFPCSSRISKRHKQTYRLVRRIQTDLHSDVRKMCAKRAETLDPREYFAYTGRKLTPRRQESRRLSNKKLALRRWR